MSYFGWGLFVFTNGLFGYSLLRIRFYDYSKDFDRDSRSKDKWGGIFGLITVWVLMLMVTKWVVLV